MVADVALTSVGAVHPTVVATKAAVVMVSEQDVYAPGKSVPVKVKAGVVPAGITDGAIVVMVG